MEPFPQLRSRILEALEEIVSIRREIHMDPELSEEEYHTQERIRAYLNRYGIPNEVSGKTGVYAWIHGEKQTSAPKRTVAIRADIDALPIEEETGLPFASKKCGVMHACGHDVHTSILLGVSRMLYEMRSEFSGMIKLFFEPAEETVGGAQFMIREGMMENPPVDAIIGLHVFPRLPAGTIELTYGKMNASTDTIHIRVEGVAGHGAYPHDAQDAVVAAGHIVCALQSVVSRNIDPVESVVVTIGEIHGGTKGNIIADEVTMRGTLRTLDPASRMLAKQRIRTLVESTAQALGVKGFVTFDEGYPPLDNDNWVVKELEAVARETFGDAQVVVAKKPSLGAESFAFFLEKAQGAFYNLGCGNVDLGFVYKGHHPKFAVDESCIPVGIEMQVRSALRLLETETR